MERGALTPGYSADPQTVVRILNEALATEIVCVLRYKRHYFMATGVHAQPAAAEFLEHANEEMLHVDRRGTARPLRPRGERLPRRWAPPRGAARVAAGAAPGQTPRGSLGRGRS